MTASIVTLLLTSLVIMGSPGPSTMSVTVVGAAYGFRRSLSYCAGLIVGTTGVLLAVAAGAVAVLLSVPYASAILLGLSAFYIFYLAWCIATAAPLSAGQERVARPEFAGGFLFALANPKAYLAIAAVFAGSTLFERSPALDTAVKLALLSLMIVLIHLVWLLAGASLARLLRDPVWARVLNIALATALAASMVRMLLR